EQRLRSAAELLRSARSQNKIVHRSQGPAKALKISQSSKAGDPRKPDQNQNWTDQTQPLVPLPQRQEMRDVKSHCFPIRRCRWCKEIRERKYQRQRSCGWPLSKPVIQ